MSSTSSPESAAFPSGSNEPECKPSPSVNPTPSVSASCDDTGQMSLFSTTCEPSPPRYFPTPDAGTSLTGHGRRGGNPDSGTQSGRTLDALARYGRLTSYAVDSPARTSAWLERAQALQASEAAYGPSSPELLARLGPDTSSLKMSAHCFQEAMSMNFRMTDAYAAGLIDGEGCISIAHRNERVFYPRVDVGMGLKGFPVLQALKASYGGSIQITRHRS